VQIRSLAAGTTGATVLLSGLALGLAGPASAAPTPSRSAPSTAATAAPVPSTPMLSVAPTSAPTTAPTRDSAPIQVPAGNAGPQASSGGATSTEIAALLGAGVLLLGGGAVLAVRRRG